MSTGRRVTQVRIPRNRSWIHRLADDAGTLSVEFALIAPLLLALLFGVIETGRLLFTQGVLYFAVQETTRFATVTPPTGDPPDYAAYESMLAQYAKDQLIIIDPNNSKPNPVVSPVPNPADNTRTVSVTINYNFDWMLPFVGQATGPITLTATSAGFLAEDG